MAKSSRSATPTTEPTKPSSNKTPCPVTRAQFRTAAKGLVVSVGGQPMVAAPKEFSTDSLGWYVNGTIVVEVDGVPCKVTVNMNAVIANSKELAK